MENLCSCRDSRVRGIICAHSLAVGLQVIKPVQATSASARLTGNGIEIVARESKPTKNLGCELTLEGSLRHLEAEIHFRYSQPNVANCAKESEALARLLECGFAEDKEQSGASRRGGSDRLFRPELPKLKKMAGEGGRAIPACHSRLVRIEPQFAIREQSDGWLDFHVHYTAGKEAVFSSADLNRLLQTGRGHVRLKDGRVAVADAALAADLEEVLRDCDPRQERGVYRVPAACRGYLEASISHWKGLAAQEPPWRHSPARRARNLEGKAAPVSDPRCCMVARQSARRAGRFAGG